jgi:hypothetical protein
LAQKEIKNDHFKLVARSMALVNKWKESGGHAGDGDEGTPVTAKPPAEEAKDEVAAEEGEASGAAKEDEAAKEDDVPDKPATPTPDERAASPAKEKAAVEAKADDGEMEKEPEQDQASGETKTGDVEMEEANGVEA